MIGERLWQRIPPERRTLAAMVAAAVVIALTLLLGIEGQRSRERLDGELPRLRASIAALERDAAEVKRLRALPAVTPGAAGQQGPGGQLAVLATNGGGLPGAQIAVIDERRVRVTSADLGFAALLEFLQNAQATHGMRVESARLEALPAAGRVRAELTLGRP